MKLAQHEMRDIIYAADRDDRMQVLALLTRINAAIDRHQDAIPALRAEMKGFVTHIARDKK